MANNFFFAFQVDYLMEYKSFLCLYKSDNFAKKCNYLMGYILEITIFFVYKCNYLPVKRDYLMGYKIYIE